MRISIGNLRAFINEVVTTPVEGRLSWEEACVAHEALMKKHVFSVDPRALAMSGMTSAEIAQVIKDAAARVTAELPMVSGWTTEELWNETVVRKKSSFRGQG